MPERFPIGARAGLGYAINLPVPKGADEDTWVSLVEHIVVPAAEQFRRRLKSPWMPAGLTMDLDAMRTECLVEIDAVAWLGPR